MAQRKQPVIPDQLLDQLLAGADAKATFEKDGLLDELKKALAERVLNAEMDHHLQAGETDGADQQPQRLRPDRLSGTSCKGMNVREKYPPALTAA